MPAPGFLSGALRPVTLPENTAFEPVGLALGQGNGGLEVVVATAKNAPRAPNVRSAWKQRNAGRAAPLLLVVLHANKATVCGPAGDDPPAYEGLDAGQAEHICRQALDQPDRHAALRFLRDVLPAVAESPLPGVRNEGFLATHTLEALDRNAAEWQDAAQRARPALARGDETLLRALGYTIEPADGATSILRAGPKGAKLAVAVLLRPGEAPDLEGGRFSGLSPVSYALHVADREHLPYVVVARGGQLRLYPVKLGVGVGRRGRTETYLEIHPGHLRDDQAAYLWLLFSGQALAEGGSLDRLLEQSRRFAGELARKLRERIYGEVVPALAQGIAVARGLKKPAAKDLADTYEMAMTVLFRLLFIAYAEDKDLLPYKWNGLYRSRSLKTKAGELVQLYPHGLVIDDRNPFDDKTTHWDEVVRLFRAVEEGNHDWGVPPYGGALFSRDPEESPAGARLADLALPNTVLGPVLWHLLVIDTREGWGPVDFRSLSVREFGTVYEGLLESELSLAEVPLAVDERGFYRPCQAGETPVVKKGRVYLHNRSGARKATGTYFTKEFAVEHLLDNALEPALADHAARLDAIADADEAAARFFDFRVADIAMGSGHFLVAAVDRIERAFTNYLAKRPLPGVRRELSRLRESAVKELDTLAEQVEIEDTQLLRRQIARRCVYGVDLNPVAVNLARLSIWIHTFVPGLPLSLLDHNLVAGNSLVGIGRVGEIEEKVKEDDLPLFPIDAAKLVGEALGPLDMLARIADATLAEVKRARKAMAEAREAVRPAEALCDIVTACRLTGEPLPVSIEQWDALKESIAGSPEHLAAREALAHLPAFHFPVAFPGVFLRERSGFDVILGNPPWEKARVEEHAFWARHEPGLRSLPQREYEKVRLRLREERPDLVELLEKEAEEAAAMRRALLSGVYPGMGTGDPDLFKAFAWRFWNLISDHGGRVGMVLPRTAFAGKGTQDFRQAVFENSRSAQFTLLVNRRQWVFDAVHPQYTIGLVAICKHTGERGIISLWGPFTTSDRFHAGAHAPPSRFAVEDVYSWTDTASLPLLTGEGALDVFVQMRKSPRLDENDHSRWRARPHVELHATNDKQLMDLESEEQPANYWPVYKGESFDIWNPDRGIYYAWADPQDVLPVLQESRARGGRNSRSPFSEFSPIILRNSRTLPCHRPRIAFRDVSRATDSRTVRVALIPPRVFVNHKAPYFLWPRGKEADQAYLLGILASIPFDWFARRFVELGLTYSVLNPLPVPRPAESSVLRKRVIQLAGRLAASDERFAEWAESVGVPCGPLPEAEKQDHIHELDAVVAHLYGLEEKHLVHVFETFHEGWDYADRLAATLKHYRTGQGKA